MNGIIIQPLLGLTGAVGSGKTTATRILERLGARIIDADVLARECTAPQSPQVALIGERLGARFLTKEGGLDRRALRDHIFRNAADRKTLEGILHPCIRQRFQAELQAARLNQPPYPCIIAAIPLLFESEADYQVDATIVIAAPKQKSIDRLIQRDGCKPDLAEAMYESQMPLSEKVKRATFVVQNDRDIPYLESQLEQLFPKLLDVIPPRTETKI